MLLDFITNDIFNYQLRLLYECYLRQQRLDQGLLGRRAGGPACFVLRSKNYRFVIIAGFVSFD